MVVNIKGTYKTPFKIVTSIPNTVLFDILTAMIPTIVANAKTNHLPFFILKTSLKHIKEKRRNTDTLPD